MTLGLPKMALSVRAPWSHALAMGWKDIENRRWRKPNPGLKFRGPVCIHASCHMTREEYEHTRATVQAIGYDIPAAHELRRGGIVGVATIVDIVKDHKSPWFFGPIGLVIADARPVKFVPAAGALGFFQWKEADQDYPPKPAKWMLPTVPQQETFALTAPTGTPPPDLFTVSD